MNDRTVAYTPVAGKYVVSTVRLLMDHGFSGTPMWYETMVFHANDTGDITDFCELACHRYETRGEAEVGHANVVREWEAKR